MDACMEVLSTLQNIRETVIEDYTRSVFLPPCRYTSGETEVPDFSGRLHKGIENLLYR